MSRKYRGTIMRQFSEFYEAAIRLIAEGTYPKAFANLFYEYFRIPIIIVDEAYKLIAYANDGTFDDPYWEDIVKNGAARSETITSHYLKAGYLESISGSNEAIYVDWGVSRDYPQTCGPVFVNKELEGFISLLFMDKSIKEEVCRLNTMVCSLFAILLQTSDFQKKTMRNPIRQVFARRFFDPDSFAEPLDEETYRPYVVITPEYQIAVIGSFREDDTLREHIRGRIRSLYPNVIYLFNGENLFVLLEGRNASNSQLIRQRLNEILRDYMLHIGLSRRFSDVSDRERHIEQAVAALHAGLSKDPDKTLYTFKEYYPTIVYQQAVSALSEKNLIPDELEILGEYDRKHESDYLRSLHGYLYQRNDLNRASEYIHIHRNTMRYRLEKIRQILGIDPDDPETALRLELGYGIRDVMKERKI